MRQGGRTILVIGRNFFSPRETTIKRFQVADTVTWIRGAHALKAGFDVNNDTILNFFPGNFSRQLHVRQPGQLQPRARPAAATCRPSRGGHHGPGDPARHHRVRGLRAGRVEGQQGPHPEPGPPLRHPELRAARRCGTRTRSWSRRGSTPASSRPTRTTSRPRLGLAWTPNPRTVVRGGLRPLLRPHAVDHGGHRPLQQRDQRADHHAHRARGAALSERSSRSIPTRGGRAAAHDLRVRAGLREPGGPPGQPGRGVRPHRRHRGGGQLPLRGGRNLQRSIDINVRRPPTATSPSLGGGSVAVQRFLGVRPFTNFDRIIQFQSSCRVHLQRPDPGGPQAVPREAPGQPRVHAGQGGGHQAGCDRSGARRVGRREVRVQPGGLRGRPGPRRQRPASPPGVLRLLGPRRTGKAPRAWPRRSWTGGRSPGSRAPPAASPTRR